MSETEEFSGDFVSIGHFPPGIVPRKLGVIRYKGEREEPEWMDLEPGQYTISTVT